MNIQTNISTRYAFEFISSFDGWADYRLYKDGRADTRISVNVSTGEMRYSDRSPVLWAEAQAFQAVKDAQLARALAAYPEQAKHPAMWRRLYRPTGAPVFSPLGGLQS